MWTGVIKGTNNADLSAEISKEPNGQYIGLMAMNDRMFGTMKYYCIVTLNSTEIILDLEPMINGQIFDASKNPLRLLPGQQYGNVRATGIIHDNKITGTWKSTINTMGTFELERAKPTAMSFDAFVIMRIKGDNSEYDDTLISIKRALDSLNIASKRVDEIEHSKKITDVITESIRKSKYIVCDLTDERPNVYYELGYAHGKDKEVILTAKKGTELHFDIKDYNVIFYDSFKELEERIKKRILKQE
jgi:hypothetical protein